MSEKTAREIAFEIAASCTCTSVENIQWQLAREGFDRIQISAWRSIGKTQRMAATAQSRVEGATPARASMLERPEQAAAEILKCFNRIGTLAGDGCNQRIRQGKDCGWGVRQQRVSRRREQGKISNRRERGSWAIRQAQQPGALCLAVRRQLNRGAGAARHGDGDDEIARGSEFR